MKKYLLLTIGFEKPTAEIMAKWGQWFDKIKDKMVDAGHFAKGKEITHSGVRDLPLERNSTTGYTIITAESMAEAEKIAKECPIIVSIQVFEINN